MTEARARGPLGGIAAILLAGLLLGLVYNWLGLHGRHRWGLEWIAQDRLEAMETVRASGDGGPPSSSLYRGSDDPLAVPGSAAVVAGLPEIPAVGRPVQIEVGAVRQYVDAGAALVVDAREREEFVEGHIPGAVSLPYDEAITDPVLVQNLDTGGRPIITYCGGGTCEQSLSLADELYYAGHDRVAVYMGGFPEWVEQGHPVERGEGG